MWVPLRGGRKKRNFKIYASGYFVSAARFIAILLISTLSAPLLADETGKEGDANQNERRAAAVPAGNEQAIRAGWRLAPKAFRQAAAKVTPSMVTIEGFGGVSTARQGGIRGVSKPGDGPTTGLIISRDGYIVTSTFNFLRRPPVITVVLHDGTRHVAKLLGRDETRKICLLKIEDLKQELKVPQWAPADQLKVGQWAVSVGVGFGDAEPAISVGIISALGRISGRAVQTDANISPANYGGPLIDVQGRVIGVCVPLSPNQTEVTAGVEWYDSGIGFAVPLAVLLTGAEPLLSALKEGKTLRRARLGIQVKPAKPDGSGVLVAKVQDDSAAAKAGIQVDDQITHFDNTPVFDALHLRMLIARHVAGETASLTVKRGDEQLNLEVALDTAAQLEPR